MALPAIRPDNPAEIGYPATFPIELALRVAPVQDICEAYGITRDQWDVLRFDPIFKNDLAEAAKLVRKEGMSFKLKAKLQSEELLKTSWKMIHDRDTPPAVRADLLKFTIKAAELDGTPRQGNSTGTSAFQININLG